MQYVVIEGFEQSKQLRKYMRQGEEEEKVDRDSTHNEVAGYLSELLRDFESRWPDLTIRLEEDSR